MNKLIFKDIYDFRKNLIKLYKKGGVNELKKYIYSELTKHRRIEIDKKTSSIFDVQLRYLNDNEPGDIIVDFKNNPTPENSMLLIIINLINVEPNLQLLIRKEL